MFDLVREKGLYTFAEKHPEESKLCKDKNIPNEVAEFSNKKAIFICPKCGREKEYRIATYIDAKIKQIGENSVTVKQGGFEFTAKLLKKKAQPLAAPTNGNMCRTIHESASCKAYYRFSHKDRILCEFTTDKASFEFEYN